MKRPLIIIFLVILCFLVFALTIFLRHSQVDEETERKNYLMQLGTYVLDLKRTNMGPYSKDSLLYKQLTIEFKSDSTFFLNMKVPFIADSAGKWSVGGSGLDDWNWLNYDTWRNQMNKKNRGDQFTRPWTKDSIFYINSATPQKGAKSIQEIYFRKQIR